jgi:hypothetical protein
MRHAADERRGWIIGTLLNLESSDRKVMAAVNTASPSRSCIPRVGVDLIEYCCLHEDATPSLKLRDLHEASL